MLGMQEASMKLTESLHEVYEPDWYGREEVKMVGEKCDVLWEDFHHDSARHHLEALQSSKRMDESLGERETVFQRGQ